MGKFLKKIRKDKQEQQKKKNNKEFFELKFRAIIEALEYNGLQFENCDILYKGMENVKVRLKDSGKVMEVRY